MPPRRQCFVSGPQLSTALRNVFLSTAETSSHILPLPILAPLLSHSSSLYHAIQTQRSQQIRGIKRRATDNTEELLEAAASVSPIVPRRNSLQRWARPDRDEGIASPFVVIADRESGILSRPQQLRDVLESFDRKEYFLIKVGNAGPQKPEDARLERPRGWGNAPFGQQRVDTSPPDERGWPLCKIMPKKEVYEKEAAKEKAHRRQEMKSKRADGKTVELGWTMADGDLKHRMRKAKEILEDGQRLSIAFDKKRRRDVIDPATSRTLLEKVLAEVGELKGVKESRRSGKEGESLKIVFDRKT